MTGRPSDFTPDLAGLICDRISEGATVRKLCELEDMPGRTTLLRWLNQHEEFRTQYTRACELRADAWADEILEIADDGGEDWKASDSGDKFNAEHVQRSKLRVDARKWLMSKAAPKKYGEKVQQVHTGLDDGPIQAEIGERSDTDRARALALLLAKNKAAEPPPG